MDRRGFLKVLAGAIVAPSVLLKTKELESPPQVLKGIPVRVHPEQQRCGVTNAQLQELIQITLDDLPKSTFLVTWPGYYDFCRFYKK